MREKTFKRVGAAVIAIVVVQSIILATANMIFENLFPAISSTSSTRFLITNLLLLFISYPIGVAISNTKVHGKIIEPLRERKISIVNMILFTLSIYGIFSLINYLNYGLIFTISKIANIKAHYTSFLTNYNDQSLVNVILLTVILIPILEELFFRKLIYKKVSDYGDKVYMLFSSIIFGLFHFSFFQSIYYFIFGMVLSYLYIYTSKVIYPIILHIAVNFLTLGLPEIAEKLMNPSALATFDILFSTIVGFIGFIIFYFFTMKKLAEFDLTPGTRYITDKQTILANIVSILIDLIGFIIIIILINIFKL